MSINTKMVFVVSRSDDANVSIYEELNLINFMMTAFPGNLFFCRGTFLLTELFNPRPSSEWADYYLNIVEYCDAVFSTSVLVDHPVIDYATDLGVPVIHDMVDLELLLVTPRMVVGDEV